MMLASLSTHYVLGQMSGYYQESFEGEFPPEDWQVVNVLDASYTWVHSPYTVFSGNYSVYDGSAIGQGEDWLILPQFSVVATDSFSFWFTAESLGFTDSTLILVSTSDDDLESFTNVLGILSDGMNYPPVANLYQYHAYSLSAFAGQDVYVAFKNRNNEGDGVYLDLVSIGSPLGTGMINPGTISFSAFPIPFREVTNIFFSINKSSTVRVSIFDELGNELAVIDDGILSTGKYHVTWDGSDYAPGIYFCRMIVDENVFNYRLVKSN